MPSFAWEPASRLRLATCSQTTRSERRGRSLPCASYCAKQQQAETRRGCRVRAHREAPLDLGTIAKLIWTTLPTPASVARR
jgi:hypothetical protein